MAINVCRFQVVDANCGRFGMDLDGEMLGCPFQYFEKSFIRRLERCAKSISAEENMAVLLTIRGNMMRRVLSTRGSGMEVVHGKSETISIRRRV